MKSRLCVCAKVVLSFTHTSSCTSFSKTNATWKCAAACRMNEIWKSRHVSPGHSTDLQCRQSTQFVGSDLILCCHDTWDFKDRLLRSPLYIKSSSQTLSMHNDSVVLISQCHKQTYTDTKLWIMMDLNELQQIRKTILCKYAHHFLHLPR